MGTKLKELRLISFIKSQQDEINSIQKKFVTLFNECGLAYDDSSMQLGFTGAVIGMLLKNSKMPPNECKKLLDNVSKKFK